MPDFGIRAVSGGLGGGGGRGLGSGTLRSPSIAPIKQSVNTDSGRISLDSSQPDFGIGQSLANIGDFAAGAAGGLLGAVGGFGIPGGPNIGDIPEAIGAGLGAVGSLRLPGVDEGDRLPTNPTLGGTLGGGGVANVGAIPGAMMDVLGLPGRAVERANAQRRIEARQSGGTDWLSTTLAGFSEMLLGSLGIGGIVGVNAQNNTLATALRGGQDALPQDIADRLDAGTLTVDQAGDELVARGAGFSNNPAANLASEVLYDPLNLIGGAAGKAGRFAQQAGVAVETGRAHGIERFVGSTYNAATHAMTASQQRVITKLAGPATAGVAQAIGPEAVQGTIGRVSGALGESFGNAVADALASGNAHYIRSSVAYAIAQQVKAGISRAAQTFRTPDEVARLIDEGVQAQSRIGPKAFIRSVEDYARRTLPTVISRDDTIGKLAQITGATRDDAARALGNTADDLATQQTIHLAYWGWLADRVAKGKRLGAFARNVDAERLTPIAPDTLTRQRAIDAFGIAQDEAGKVTLSVADDALPALVEQFDDLARYRGGAFDAAKVRSFVAKLYEGDYLPTTLIERTAKDPNAIPKELGDIRAQMQEFGYELGFGPKDGWRVIEDAEGNIVRQSPFVAVSSASDPLTVRNPFGRFMDSVFRGVTQERIIIEARARLARRVAPLGVNEIEARDIQNRVLTMSRELGVSPRGIGFGAERSMVLPSGGSLRINRYDQAFLDVIGPERFEALIGKHDPTTLIMQAFQGNLRAVGITQYVSGAAKAIPRVGNAIAYVAENLYPMVKFRLNALFQSQEAVESPILNLGRGVAQSTDPELAALYRGLTENNDEFRWLSGAEYTLNVAGSVSVQRAFGDSLIGRLVERVPNISGMKQRLELAQVITEHPDEFQAVVLRVNPRFWQIMEETYGTTDAAAITRAFVKERAAGTGSLPDALKQIDTTLDDSLAALLRSLGGGTTIPAGNVAASQAANVALGVAKGGTAASGGAIKATRQAAGEADYAMETIWNAFRESARSRAEQAFRTHYFSASRSFFERSINHPFLGLYPASYMFGKVLPEFARFLLLRPFGKRVPLVGAAALQKVQGAYVAQLATDPEFAGWIQEHPDALYLVNMLMPGIPTDLGARSPSWATSLAERSAAGKPVDAEAVQNSLDRAAEYSMGVFKGPKTIATGIFDLIDGLNIGQVEQNLDNAAKAYDGWFSTTR